MFKTIYEQRIDKNMKIIDTWKQNGNMFAYCVGENITPDFSCKKILSNEMVYEVKAVDIQVSFTGKVSATLMLDEKVFNNLQLGEFKVVL